MSFKKIIWIFKRHPSLYLTRFRLLSKNSSFEAIEKHNYNIINSANDIPNYFNDVNRIIFKGNKPNSDLKKVKKLCVWLNENIKGGPGLSQPSETALRVMLEGKGGVCSDMAQIFNNFCVINNIMVREWGATRAPYNNSFGGHSFNEVFISELNKWVMIDAYYCTLFYDENGKLVSLAEFFQKIRKNERVRYKLFNGTNAKYIDNIEKNYYDPDTIPFLVCNYSNKTYDWYLRKFRPHIPVFMIHFFIFLIGKSYIYKFPIDDYRNIFIK